MTSRASRAFRGRADQVDEKALEVRRAEDALDAKLREPRLTLDADLASFQQT